VQQVGIPIEVLTPTEAQKRFSVFQYQPEDMVIVDPTCAVIAAADVLRGLQSEAAAADCYFDTRVHEIDLTCDPIQVHTTDGVIMTERLVITAGPWTGKLVPSLDSRLSVIRQTVAYVEMEGESSAYQPGAFPVWIYLEKEQNEHFYGLPEFQRSGIKVARHVTSGGSYDPDFPGETEPARITDVMDFVTRKFRPKIDRLAAVEHCYYTNTETTDYILDHHPENSRVVVGAGFSGHGFKLGPVSGRILAELVMHGKTSLTEFESNRAVFQIPTVSS
jgi:glycine/D-amino acid oxidase-like deaminating enzyme